MTRMEKPAYHPSGRLSHPPTPECHISRDPTRSKRGITISMHEISGEDWVTLISVSGLRYRSDDRYSNVDKEGAEYNVTRITQAWPHWISKFALRKMPFDTTGSV